MAPTVYTIPDNQKCEKRIKSRQKPKKRKGRWLSAKWSSRRCTNAATRIVGYRYYCDEHSPNPKKFNYDPYYDSTEWRELRSRVLQRDKGICQYCGGKAHQADHVIPRSKRGPDSMENLVACCPPCNKAALSAVFRTFEDKKAYILTHRKIAEPRPIPEKIVRDKAVNRPVVPKSLFKKKLASRIRDKNDVS